MIENEQGTTRARVHQSPYRAYGGKYDLALEKISANPGLGVVELVGHIGAWRDYIDFESALPTLPISGELQPFPPAQLLGSAAQTFENRGLVQHIQAGLSQITDVFLLVAISNLIETTSFDMISDELRMMAESSNFLGALYRNKNTSSQEDVVLLVVQTVFGWLSSGSYRALDFVMKSAQPESLSTEVIVALLRTSSRKASFLPNWSRFLGGSRDALAERDEDFEKMLSGL